MVSTLNSEFPRLLGACLQARDRKESRDEIEESRKISFRMPRSVAATAGPVWASSNRTSISTGASGIQTLMRLYVRGQGFLDQPYLSDAGYKVTEVELPDLNSVWQLWCNLIMTELQVLQEEQMRATTGADFENGSLPWVALHA